MNDPQAMLEKIRADAERLPNYDPRKTEMMIFLRGLEIGMALANIAQVRAALKAKIEESSVQTQS